MFLSRLNVKVVHLITFAQINAPMTSSSATIRVCASNGAVTATRSLIAQMDQTRKTAK